MTVNAYKIGAVNGVGALYTYPSANTAQFTDGCDVVWDAGLRTIKLWLTDEYSSQNYTKETFSGGAVTTLTGLAQKTEFSDEFSRGWDTIILSTYTFANTDEFWLATNSLANFDDEYDEIYDLTVHLLTTYQNSGTTFIISNWEGDWAYMGGTPAPGATEPDYYIDREVTDFYAAWLATRQRAVHDAVKATAHINVKVLNAIELNRVMDLIAYPHRRRVIKDIAKRVQPDVISYSAYDSTLPDTTKIAISLATWETWCRTNFAQALQMIRAAFPNSIIQIGEFGIPENQLANEGIAEDAGDLIDVIKDVCDDNDVQIFIYWQSMGNDDADYGGFGYVTQTGSDGVQTVTINGTLAANVDVTGMSDADAATAIKNAINASAVNTIVTASIDAGTPTWVRIVANDLTVDNSEYTLAVTGVGSGKSGDTLVGIRGYWMIDTLGNLSQAGTKLATYAPP
jgi:hypothetical protein